MILESQRQGSGPPLVILHGMFGSGDNWRSVAQRLGERYTAVSLDLRNHGSSAHRSSMSYYDMSYDVAETLEKLGIEPAHLLGHSMGGKVAMYLALEQPQRALSLVVVDIAPKRYPAHHQQILTAMPELDRAGVRSRKQADELLSRYVDNRVVRAFLLKSVAADETGVYRWTLNADAIVGEYNTIADWPEPSGVYEGPTLLLRGGASGYVDNTDLQTAKRWFPAARLEQIAGAGHWVHAEKRDQFCDAVNRFLESQS